jgi:hypothetical protein
MDAERLRACRLRLAVLPALCLAALTTASCDAPSVNGPTFGYDPSISYAVNGVDYSFLYHWPLGTAVRVYVDPAQQPTGWDLAAAVDAAGPLWLTQLYYREETIRRVSSPADADVVVHYDAAPPVDLPPADCTLPFVQAAGITVLCPTADYAALQILPLADGGGGRVKMDVTIVPSRIADAAQLRRVVAHEIGHVLGIGAHSSDRADLMFPVPQVDAPSAADGQTLRYVLHQSAAVVP